MNDIRLVCREALYVLFISPFIFMFWGILGVILSGIVIFALLTFYTASQNFILPDTNLDVLFFVLMGGIALSFLWFYIAYWSGKTVIRLNEKLSMDRRSPRKKAEYIAHQLATPIEQLPTSDNIQEMLAHDGEIPDEAFQQHSS